MLATGVVQLALAGALLTSPAAAAPCLDDTRLAGIWESERESEPGVSELWFRFNCNCRYVARVQALGKTITEKGKLEVYRGRIRFLRKSGVTRWPYSFEDGTLILEEAEKERHRYRRVERFECGGAP